MNGVCCSNAIYLIYVILWDALKVKLNHTPKYTFQKLSVTDTLQLNYY